MKTIKIISQKVYGLKPILLFMLAVLLIFLLWQVLPTILQMITPEIGLLDNSIWQLLLFSCICFAIMLIIVGAIFNWLIKSLSLAPIHQMVLQIKNLQLWQQFVLYWASFALLFLGSLLSLAAIF